MSENLAPLEEKADSNNLSLLDQQRYQQRKVLFRVGLGVCIGMYALFIVAMSFFWLIDNFVSLFAGSQHVAILVMALLVIPSLILGRMIRAAFMKDDSKPDELQTPIQQIASKFND